MAQVQHMFDILGLTRLQNVAGNYIVCTVWSTLPVIASVRWEENLYLNVDYFFLFCKYFDELSYPYCKEIFRKDKCLLRKFLLQFSMCKLQHMPVIQVCSFTVITNILVYSCSNICKEIKSFIFMPRQFMLWLYHYFLVLVPLVTSVMNQSCGPPINGCHSYFHIQSLKSIHSDQFFLRLFGTLCVKKIYAS